MTSRTSREYTLARDSLTDPVRTMASSTDPAPAPAKRRRLCSKQAKVGFSTGPSPASGSSASPLVADEKRAMTMIVGGLEDSSSHATADAWLTSTLRGLGGPQHRNSFHRPNHLPGCIPNQATLFAEFASNADRDHAVALLKSTALGGHRWASIVAEIPTPKQKHQNTKTGIKPARPKRRQSAKKVPKDKSPGRPASEYVLKPKPTLDSLPNWLKQLANDMDSPIEWNAWQSLVSESLQDGLFDASVFVRHPDAWRLCMQLKFGDDWEADLKAQRTKAAQAALADSASVVQSELDQHMPAADDSQTASLSSGARGYATRIRKPILLESGLCESGGSFEEWTLGSFACPTTGAHEPQKGSLAAV